jgi:hypothetical protein
MHTLNRNKYLGTLATFTLITTTFIYDITLEQVYYIQTWLYRMLQHCLKRRSKKLDLF